MSVPSRRLKAVLANERVARFAGSAVTALLIAALVVAWGDVVPPSSLGGEVRLYAIEGAVDPETLGAVGTELPVFVLRDGRGAIRHGIARVRPDGLLRVELYGSPLPGFAAATEPLLFEPGLTAMWVTASEDSRQELETRIAAVQDEVARTLERVVASEVFAVDYRPVLRAVFGDALNAAWTDGRARAALDQVLATGSRTARYELQGRVAALLERRVEAAIWDFLAANWTYLPAAPFGVELDLSPVQAVIDDAFTDPELLALMSAFAGRVVEMDETRLVAERLTIGAVDALLRDPRLTEVAARMFADPFLRADVEPLSDAMLDLAGAVPRHLGGLGAESDLNPLAAHVFKAMTLNASIGFVMFVTPEARARIREIDAEAAVPLLLERSGTGVAEPQ